MTTTPPNFVTTDRLPLPVHFIELYDYDGSAMFWTTQPIVEKDVLDCCAKIKAEMTAWVYNDKKIWDETINNWIPNPDYNESLTQPRNHEDILFEKFGLTRLKPHYKAPHP